MKRVEPTVAALVVALLASLAVHLPVYGVLGVMTKWLDFQPTHFKVMQ